MPHMSIVVVDVIWEFRTPKQAWLDRTCKGEGLLLYVREDIPSTKLN